MFRNIKTLKDVVDWEMCIGCGACYYSCDKGAIKLVNIQEIGIRPTFSSPECASCSKCLSICPGYSIDGGVSDGKASHAEHEFGPALEIWEGHAQDPEIRFQASSGGLLSALALYCLEHEAMNFVLHTGVDPQEPWVNRTVKSTSRSEVLSRTGSRYAPSSPCDSLQDIEDSHHQCVFIGKPCDTAAVSMLRRQRSELDKKLGLVLTFFCAGTPSTRGTLDLITSFGIRPTDVNAVRYRGQGWPGNFKVQYAAGTKEKSLTYAESWGRLTSYRSLRCNLCPDGLGRVADISCGDAWEKHTGDGDEGRSIVIVRTERGRYILNQAIAANYLQLERVDVAAVLAAQPALLQRRREIFGRLLGMGLLGAPTPRFPGFSLFRSWIRQPMQTKIRTVLGTMSRAIRRSWWRRRRGDGRTP